MRTYLGLNPTSTGEKSGNVSITSTGAETKNVAVSGTGIGTSSYCAAGSTLQNEYIGNVKIGSINAGSGLGIGGYQDATSLSTILHLGASTTLEISLGNDKTTDQILQPLPMP